MITPSTRAVCVALVLGLAAIALPRPSRDSIPCPTCAGKGRVQETCHACEGTRRLRCPGCRPFSVDELLLLRDDYDEERLAELEGLRVTQDALANIFIGEWSAPTRPKVGHLLCPGLCYQGRLPVSDEKCRLCRGKGLLTCKACKKKGYRPCTECDRDGRATVACKTCLGAGNLPDPVDRADGSIDTCGWCGGGATSTCPDCGERARAERTCPVCLGKEVMACFRCRGLKRRPCSSCGGSGREVTLDKATSEPCKACRQKAILDCDRCGGKGQEPCLGCDGDGRHAFPCLICRGSRSVPCEGCAGGGYGYWDACVPYLERTGSPQEALRHSAVALARHERHYAGRLEAVGADEDLLLELRRERDRERKRLKLRHRALQRAVKAGGG